MKRLGFSWQLYLWLTIGVQVCFDILAWRDAVTWPWWGVVAPSELYAAVAAVRLVRHRWK